MTQINNAERGIGDTLVNKLTKVERDLNDLKTTPQLSGNGSMAKATFTPFSLGPVSVAAGGRQSFTLVFMPLAEPFTYNGALAINQFTLQDFYVTHYVDAHDAAHAGDIGASLTAGQVKVDALVRNDYLASGLAADDGEFLIVVKVINNDSSSHNVYLDGTALIPRPALKPL